RKSFFFITRAAPGEIEQLLVEVPEHVARLSKRSSNKLEHPNPPTAAQFSYGQVDLSHFRMFWEQGGIPLIVGNLQSNLTLPWDPEFIIKNWGDQPCFLHDCTDAEGQTVEQSTVCEFFEGFATSTFRGQTRSLKLKDWPPTSEFKMD